jgi:uncharacterized RDD family membrane protein YckC
MNVTPAAWNRRVTAQLLDLGLLAALLTLIAKVLPYGPPPVRSMSFFTVQDFIIYFTLVAAAILLTFFAFQSVKVTKATPGQKLLKLRLTALDGKAPRPEQVNVRRSAAFRNILLIMLPGPIIALIVGVTVAVLLNAPFTTTDKLLLQLEIPKGIRYMIHGLSFLALIAATWTIAIRPAIRYFEKSHGGLTKLDMKSGTTHVLANKA